MSIVKGFRAADHQSEDRPVGVLPAGPYEVQVVNVEERATKDGHGMYLWLELEVLRPTHVGRKLFDRIHLVNRSEKAVEIAQRQLASLCQAAGIEELVDSSELVGHVVVARVRVRPPRGEYGEDNEVSGYGGGLKRERVPVTQSMAMSDSFDEPKRIPPPSRIPPARRLPASSDDDLPF
jgi:hypothetical protein